MSEKKSDMPTRSADQPGGIAFAVVSLLAVLLIIYGNSFFGEWHFDDYHNIVDNRNVHLQTLSWDDIHRSFYGTAVEPRGRHLTRPLSYLSFGLNYFLGGTDVFGYHVVNFSSTSVAPFFCSSLCSGP